MSTNHPSPVAQAFDTIHEEMRRLQRENGDLRRQINQKIAALSIATDRNSDLEKHITRLRGAMARKFGVDANGGEDIDAIVRVVA